VSSSRPTRAGTSQDNELLDPVAAYDRLAPFYPHFSNRRAAYLRSIEDQIIARITPQANSLLDIGGGDGTRALRIAHGANISRVALLEPSAQMSAGAKSGELWRLRAEDLDLSTISERFDVITCLWNVFGHILASGKRTRVLQNAAQLLSTDGLFFLDVIHRYNIRSYGIAMTAARWLRDRIARNETNGDVVADWNTSAGHIRTYGHVFTDGEMRALAQSAGVKLIDRLVIDYESGSERRLSWLGNLLYVLRRNS
jgi:2-polyprenyl-3-methyl-5-hydroxy-6-metoxy-1,4-benzoquinol methylase